MTQKSKKIKDLSDDEIREIVKDNVLTTAQVVELLGVTRQHLNNLMKQGKIKATLETANGYLFVVADIKDYVVKYKKTHLKLYNFLIKNMNEEGDTTNENNYIFK